MNVNNIPFMDFGGNGDIIHFAHANGFPVGSYKKLISHLAETHRVIGMNARPMWKGSDPDSVQSWHTMADDLIGFLDAKGYSNIIGMGHSFGAIITLSAAIKRPDLFSKLVLIEPVVLAKPLFLGVRLLPIFARKKLFAIVKTAINRTDLWENRQEVFAQFRIKPLFGQIPDEVLWDYVTAGTIKTADGKYTLKYPKEWEAHVFSTIIDPWSALKKVQHPTLIVRGQHTDVITSKTWDQLRTTGKSTTLLEVPETGHLLPLEKPEQLSTGILSFLRQAKL